MIDINNQIVTAVEVKIIVLRLSWTFILHQEETQHHQMNDAHFPLCSALLFLIFFNDLNCTIKHENILLSLKIHPATIILGLAHNRSRSWLTSYELCLTWSFANELLDLKPVRIAALLFMTFVLPGTLLSSPVCHTGFQPLMWSRGGQTVLVRAEEASHQISYRWSVIFKPVLGERSGRISVLARLFWGFFSADLAAEKASSVWVAFG